MAIFSITNDLFECSKMDLKIDIITPCELTLSSSIELGLSNYILYIDDSPSGLIPFIENDRYIYEVPLQENTNYKFQIVATCDNTSLDINSTPVYYQAGQLPNTTDIFAFFDTTSMIPQDGVDASNALNNWYNMYKTDNPDFEGNLYIMAYDAGTANLSERYLQLPRRIWTGEIGIDNSVDWSPINILPPNLNTPSWISPANVLILAFFDESNPEYHSNSLSNGFTSAFFQPNDADETITLNNSLFSSLTPPLTITSVTNNLVAWNPYITYDNFTNDAGTVSFDAHAIASERVQTSATIGVTATDGVDSQQIFLGFSTLLDAGVISREPQPSLTYIEDYEEMITFIPNFDFMRAVLYPIPRILTGEGGALILQSLGAMKGRILTNQEVIDLGTNVDVSLIETENPYSNFEYEPGQFLQPLEAHNWTGVYNKESPASEVFNSETFAEELNDIIASNEQECPS